MKLLRTDTSVEARFSVVLILFTIASRGLSLPQQMKTMNEPQEKTNVHPNRPVTMQLIAQERSPFSDLKEKQKVKTSQNELQSDSAIRIVTSSPHLDKSSLPGLKDQTFSLNAVKSEISELGIPRSGRKEFAKTHPSQNEKLSRYSREVHSSRTSSLLQEKSKQEVPSERLPIDSILNDVHVGKGSDNVIDYYFVDDSLLREDEQRNVRHGSSVRHGVFINLTGLIPNGSEDEEIEDHESDSAAVINRNPNGGQDEILAFKAFEISSNVPSAVHLEALLADSEDQLTDESAVDYYADQRDSLSDQHHHHHSRTHSSHKLGEEDYETPASSALSESRNLSRKRRQKALPDEDEAERHSRHHFGKKRRRKRKCRNRNQGASRLTSRASSGDESHSRMVPETIATAMAGQQHHNSRRQQQRFLLKSNSPAYVITSTSEVKKDWCKTVPFKQKVVEKNCKPRYITNNFCYGQCNSFFIPHVGKGSGNGGAAAAFQSCALCKPHKYKWTTVTLSCPRQEQQRVEKRVLIVQTCRCKTETLQ